MAGNPVIDVFPAYVAAPEGTFDSVRAISDGETLWVFRIVGSVPAVVFSVPVTSLLDANPGPAAGPWTLTDESDQTWTVTRAGGCGCGNPLKSMQVNQLMGLVPA